MKLTTVVVALCLLLASASALEKNKHKHLRANNGGGNTGNNGGGNTGNNGGNTGVVGGPPTPNNGNNQPQAPGGAGGNAPVGDSKPAALVNGKLVKQGDAPVQQASTPAPAQDAPVDPNAYVYEKDVRGGDKVHQTIEKAPETKCMVARVKECVAVATANNTAHGTPLGPRDKPPQGPRALATPSSICQLLLMQYSFNKGSQNPLRFASGVDFELDQGRFEHELGDQMCEAWNTDGYGLKSCGKDICNEVRKKMVDSSCGFLKCIRYVNAGGASGNFAAHPIFGSFEGDNPITFYDCCDNMLAKGIVYELEEPLPAPPGSPPGSQPSASLTDVSGTASGPAFGAGSGAFSSPPSQPGSSEVAPQPAGPFGG